jgi:hypothetical protein
MILEHEARFLQFPSLVYCSAAACIAQVTARRWKERCGDNFEGYGPQRLRWSDLPGEREIPPGSIGKVLSTKKVKIIDEMSLQEMPAGKQAAYCLIGSYVVLTGTRRGKPGGFSWRLKDKMVPDRRCDKKG